MQDNGDGASSTVSQVGNNNDASINNYWSDKAIANVSQLGNSHEASVSQQIADGAEAQVAQSGQLNKATVTRPPIIMVTPIRRGLWQR